jgi:hypothetical protein
MDEMGVLQQEVGLTFNNGSVAIEISQGTTALTNDGTPLEAMVVQPVDNPPTPPSDCHIIGLAYDFSPDGAIFDPPITLTLWYDPASFPLGIAEKDLTIAYFDIVRGKWIDCECDVDMANHIIKAHVSHYTLFAILGKVAAAPIASGVNWSLVGGIIGGLAVIIIAIYLLLLRKRAAVSMHN